MARATPPLASRAVARCFVTRRLPGRALERLRAEHEVEVWPGRLPPPTGRLRELAGDAEGLLSMLTDRVDAALIEACPELRAISNFAVGWDNVDVATATARGIPVGYTPDVLTEATADATFALLLAAARRIVEATHAVRAGRWLTWEPDAFLGQEVHGATIGIVGMGRIGRAVARRAEGFEMRVLHTGSEGGTPLDELLDAADFVSLHTRLTPETRGLIGERELRHMKETAILVNTSRGAIVDTDALECAVRERWIAGVALDVTDPEPLPHAHPLLRLPNVIVVPHIASASRKAREAMADIAVDNLLAAFRGERMGSCVNPEVYEGAELTPRSP